MDSSKEDSELLHEGKELVSDAFPGRADESNEVHKTTIVNGVEREVGQQDDDGVVEEDASGALPDSTTQSPDRAVSEQCPEAAANGRSEDDSDVHTTSTQNGEKECMQNSEAHEKLASIPDNRVSVLVNSENLPAQNEDCLATVESSSLNEPSLLGEVQNVEEEKQISNTDHEKVAVDAESLTSSAPEKDSLEEQASKEVDAKLPTTSNEVTSAVPLDESKVSSEDTAVCHEQPISISCVQNEKPADSSISETLVANDNLKTEEVSLVSADTTVGSESVPMEVNESSANSETEGKDFEPMDVDQSTEEVSLGVDKLNQSDASKAQESDEFEALPMDQDAGSVDNERPVEDSEAVKDVDLKVENVAAEDLNECLLNVEKVTAPEMDDVTDLPSENGISAIDATDEPMELACEEERAEDVVAWILNKCIRNAYNRCPSKICSDIIYGLIPRVINTHAKKKALETKRKNDLKRSLENESMVLGNSDYGCYEQRPISVDTVDLANQESFSDFYASQIEDLIDKNLASENRPDACLTFMVSSTGMSLRRTLLDADLNLPIGKSRNLRLECLLCGSRFDIHSRCQRHLMTAHNLLPEVLYTCNACSYDSLDKAAYVHHLIESSHRRSLGLKPLKYGDDECMEVSEDQLQENTTAVREILDDLVTDVVNSSPSMIAASLLDDLVEESINQSPSVVVSTILNDLIEDSIDQSPSEICSVILSDIVDSVAKEEEEVLVDPFSSPSHIQIAVLANVVYTTKQLTEISRNSLHSKLIDLLKAESNKGNKLTFTVTSAGITLGRSAGPSKQHPLPFKTHKGPSRWNCKLCSKSYTMKQRMLKHLLDYHKYDRDVIYKCSACRIELLDLRHLVHHVYTNVHMKAVAGQTDSSMLWQHDLQEAHEISDHELLRKHRVRPSIVRVVRLEDVRAGEHLSERPKPTSFMRRYICGPCNSSFHAAYQLKDHMQSAAHKRAVERRPGLLYNCPVCKVTLLSRKNIFCHFESISHRNAIKAQRPSNKPKTQESTSIKLESKKESVATAPHSKVNIPKRPLLTCKICRAQFRSSVQYNQHMTQKHPKASKSTIPSSRQSISGFNCDICCKTFSSALRIKLHYMSLPHREELLKKHGHQESIKCRLCNLNFRLNRFIMHQQSSKHLQMMIANSAKPAKCRKCGKGFSDNYKTARHESTCQINMPSKESETVVRVKETKKEPVVEHKKPFEQPSSASSPVRHYCTTCKLHFSSLRSLSIHVRDSKIHKINVKQTSIGSLAPLESTRTSRPQSHVCVCKKEFSKYISLRCHLARCSKAKEKRLAQEVTKNVYVKLKDISPTRPKAAEKQKNVDTSSGYYCKTCVINFGHHADFLAHNKSEMHKRRLGSKRGRSPSPDVAIVEEKPPSPPAKKPKVNSDRSQQEKAEKQSHGRYKCDACNVTFSKFRHLRNHNKKTSHKLAMKMKGKVAKKVEDRVPPQKETEAPPVSDMFMEYDKKRMEFYCKLCEIYINKGRNSHKKTPRHKRLLRKVYKQRSNGRNNTTSAAPATVVEEGRVTRSSPDKRPAPVEKPTVSFACSICSKSFASSAEQNAHFGSQEHVQELLKKTMPYCDVCKMAFGTSTELEQHKSTGEHQAAVREQKKKKKPVSTPASIETPVAAAQQPEESDETNLTCDICNRSFNYLTGLKSHLKSKSHKDQAQEAEKLRQDKTVKLQEPPVKEVDLSNQDESALFCDVCNRTFTTLYHLTSHKKSRGHKDRVREAKAEKDIIPSAAEAPEEPAASKTAEAMIDLACQVCEMTFRNETGRNAHMRSKAHHKAVKEKETRPPRSVQAVSTEKEPKKYEWECTICDCSFRNHISYFNHLKSSFHTERERQGKEDKQSWECTVCDRSFRIQFAYIQHTKSAGHLKKERLSNTQEKNGPSILPSKGKKQQDVKIDLRLAKKAPAAPSLPALPQQDDNVILLDSDDDGFVSIKQEKRDTQPTFQTVSQPASSSNGPTQVLDGLVGIYVDVPKGQKAVKGRTNKTTKAEVQPVPQAPAVQTAAPAANNPCYPVAMYPGIWAPITSRPIQPQASQSLSFSMVDSTVRPRNITPQVSNVISTVLPQSSSPAVAASSVAKTNTISSSSSNNDPNKNILYGCPNCSQKFRSINAYKTHYKSVHCNK